MKPRRLHDHSSIPPERDRNGARGRHGASHGVRRGGAKLGGRKARTRYESGLSAFGVLLVRVMIVLLAAMFVVNLALHRAAIDSLLFSLALAVGITPQLLPAIETISLSTGAREMAREKVIVKRLDAIEDFGAMTVLCTDKTGTLTTGSARFEDAVDLDGRSSAEVRDLARGRSGRDLRPDRRRRWRDGSPDWRKPSFSGSSRAEHVEVAGRGRGSAIYPGGSGQRAARTPDAYCSAGGRRKTTSRSRFPRGSSHSRKPCRSGT